MFKPGQEEREDNLERRTFLSESQSPAEQSTECFELDQLKYDEKESKVSTLSSFCRRNLSNNQIAGDYIGVYSMRSLHHSGGGGGCVGGCGGGHG